MSAASQTRTAIAGGKQDGKQLKIKIWDPSQ